MKRCPKCRRDYTDDTLLYCLDDGTRLVDGPASMEEPATAILHTADAVGDVKTRAQIHTTEQTAVSPSGSDLPKRSLDRRLIAAPFLLAMILLAGFFGYRYFSSNAKQIESIAVMPFVNESGNADVEYLSDGMTETLISSLSQLPNLSVKARSSVFRYKGKDTDARTIGKELNVQAILTGTVVQRGNDLTLHVELVDASTENALWSTDYKQPVANLVSLQSDIARDVSQKLKIKLSGADERNLAKTYTESPEAYQLYLRGRYHWNKRTEKDLQKSIDYFNQAIAADPNYALALAGLADAYSILPAYSGWAPRDAYPRAREFALRALLLDGNLAEAHAALGAILTTYDYDFGRAETQYKRAIELNPNYATAYQWYGELLNYLGRHEESLAALRRGLEIDPQSLIINRIYGESLFFARRYNDAIAQHKRTIELDANFASVYGSLFSAYQGRGDHAESVEALARYYELNSNPRDAALARDSFAKDGWQGFMRAMTGERRPANFWSHIAAGFFAQLGENDKAFAELDSAFERRASQILLLKVDPRLDSLRDDPRFQELLRKVGFPE